AVHAESAGTEPGDADSIATQVMAELGIDLSDHRPHSFEAVDATPFDLVVALAARAQDAAEAKARAQDADFEYWPTPDPTAFEGSREMRLAAYRELRDALVRRIRDRLQP